MKKFNFEEKLASLEEISTKLESENTSLDEMLSLYENGVKVLKECRDFLDKAEQKVTDITQEIN